MAMDKSLFTALSIKFIVYLIYISITINVQHDASSHYVLARQVTDESNRTTLLDSPEEISSTVTGVTAFIYFVAGACLCFHGSWTATPLFAIAGLFTTTYASLAFLSWFSHWLTLGDNMAAQIMFVLVALLTGIIVALLTTYYRAIGALLTGGLLGCLVALRLAVFAGITLDVVYLRNGHISIMSSSSSSNDMAVLIIIVTLVMIVTAWITYLLEPLVIIFTTAVMGSIWCAIAIDTIWRIEFIETMTAFVYGLQPLSTNHDDDTSNFTYTNDSKVYREGWEVNTINYNGGIGSLCALVVALALAGIYLQHKYTSKSHNGYRYIRLPVLRRLLHRNNKI
ncbi:hypothetical protein BDF22DRAFT_238119 [Syncephalis plumigaleata]|nr:hypothetical protein BDF22DRAFT_238119 [Syncephalis plumigaleata]